jgi:hypothetical protein
VNLENGGGRVASRESVGERRRSSVTQDLTEYTYSVAGEPDAEVADDDDVFEMEAAGGGGGGGEPVAPGNSSGGGGDVGGTLSEANKRRTQSLGSLTGEPKSPRKVLNAAYANNLKLLLYYHPFLCRLLRPLVLLSPPFYKLLINIDQTGGSKLFLPIDICIAGKRKRSRSTAHECLHDLQQETPSTGSPAPSQSGQSNCFQDSRRMVVFLGATGETKIP